MKHKIKITHHVQKCIGNKNCLLYAPDYFKFVKDKAHLKNALKKKEIEQKEATLNDTELHKLIKAAESCPVNVISIFDITKKKILVASDIESAHAEKITAEDHKNKELIFDRLGYFLIRINRDAQQLEVGLCKKRNIISVKILGKKPEDVYQTIINNKLISRLDHAAYLGKELQKAYIALQQNLDYVQDDDLLF